MPLRMSLSRRSPARRPRRQRWTPPANAATSWCANSSARARTGSDDGHSFVISLPLAGDYESYRAFRAEPSRWLPIALEIARSHGLSSVEPHIFTTGTNLVVALGARLILKIFPPMLRSQFV